MSCVRRIKRLRVKGSSVYKRKLPAILLRPKWPLIWIIRGFRTLDHLRFLGNPQSFHFLNPLALNTTRFTFLSFSPIKSRLHDRVNQDSIYTNETRFYKGRQERKRK